MNKRRTYEAFTLVEMLVVMGILIILMVLGIAAGRFALNRAADVAHRNGADQLFEGLQAYYVDNRSYPEHSSCGTGTAAGTVACSPSQMMEDGDALSEYLDSGAFNGGSGATYIYLVGGDNANQSALICVSMRGTKAINDASEEGAYYCTGNGFDAAPMYAGSGTAAFTATTPVTTNLIEKDATNDLWLAFDAIPDAPAGSAADWDNNEWVN